MPKKQSKNRAARKRRLHGVVKPRPCGTAIMVEKDTTWFYEYRGKIEIIHWCKDEQRKNRHASHIKIPWRLLMESARRCRPEEVKRLNACVSHAGADAHKSK